MGDEQSDLVLWANVSAREGDWSKLRGVQIKI